MSKRVRILAGHPDRSAKHLGHAFAEVYGDGVRVAGGEARTIWIADLDFPLLRSPDDFASDPDIPAIRDARDSIRWAEHIALLFPLWMGLSPGTRSSVL